MQQKPVQQALMQQEIHKKVAHKILLNPGPATTSATVKQALVIADICPREIEFGEVLARVRKMAVQAVHAEHSHEAVLLPGSGTASVESVLGSLLGSDQRVLVINNGAYGERIKQICQVLRIEHDELLLPWQSAVDVVVVERHLEKNLATSSQSYSALAFVHHETTAGVLNPLDGLVELAQRHKLLSLVDAMSSYCGIPVDLRKTPVDVLVSSSNKCVQGMAGLGIVIARRSLLARPQNPRSLYLDLFANWTSQARDGQFLFTPPVQILYALEQAFTECLAETVAGRSRRYTELYAHLFAGLQELGFRFVVNKQHHSRILTAVCNPQDAKYDFSHMHDFFYTRGITIYPGKGQQSFFRLSVLGDLNLQDVTLFLAAMQEYLTQEGIKVNG